eukprot:357713-Chlamydomonas_euryale.AAC.3
MDGVGSKHLVLSTIAVANTKGRPSYSELKHHCLVAANAKYECNKTNGPDDRAPGCNSMVASIQTACEAHEDSHASDGDPSNHCGVAASCTFADLRLRLRRTQEVQESCMQQVWLQRLSMLES